MSNALSGTVYRHLCENILAGKLKLGSPLSEVAIGKELGVSRSPIREALKIMESEGLVTHFPSRGNFVVDFSLQDIDEIFDLREMFESYALRRAFQRIDKETLESIEEILVNVLDSAMPEEYFKLNKLVHETIIAYSGNRRVQRFYDQISTQIAVVNRISALDPSHFAVSTQRHLEIVRAMKANNIEEAERILLIHLKEVRSGTKKSFSFRRT